MVLDDRAALPPARDGAALDAVVAALDEALDTSTGLVDAAVRRLVRDAPIGFAVLDADLRYVLVNDFLARFAGRPEAQIVGRTVREIVPSMADVAEAAFRQVLDTGEPLRDLALTGDVLGDPGRVRHWRESVFRVETGGPLRPERGLAVLVWEVTEQVEAHRTMLDAQERLRFLARSSDLLSQSLDEDAVLDRVVRLLVPDVAGAVTVLLPDGAGRLLPVRHLGSAARPGGPPDGAASSGGTAGTSPAVAALAAFAQQRAVVADGVVHAPMVVRGRSIGVVSAALPVTAQDDVALVATLARRAAVALGNGAAGVLCTDGITEARRGPDLFGESGLVTALRTSVGRSADDVTAHVVRAVREYQVAPAADDIALLVVTLDEAPTAGGPRSAP